MSFIYAPVLKAMSSEFKALKNLEGKILDQVLPLFEVTRMKPDPARFRNSSAPKVDYLDEVARKLCDVWSGRAAMIDAFSWDPNTILENGESLFSYLYKVIMAAGVNVIPVIGYDRWDHDIYRLAIQSLEFNKVDNFCLRLDRQAIEDVQDQIFFRENIDRILSDMKLTPDLCSVLIDFGDISPNIDSLDRIISDVDSIFSVLESYGFKYFITAGCSLPNSIDKAVKKQDDVGKVVRKDFLLWKDCRVKYARHKFVCGDYGVRGPSSNEGVIAPDANGKIRYTINDHYYIARGHSMRTRDKGKQTWELAKKIIASPHYMGDDFSWGDYQIFRCSRAEIKGGHSDWISHDTNHHITYVLMEVMEFEEKLAAQLTT